MLPLIVTENHTNLEVRDCYLRSMKKEAQKNPKQPELTAVNT